MNLFYVWAQATDNEACEVPIGTIKLKSSFIESLFANERLNFYTPPHKSISDYMTTYTALGLKEGKRP